MKNDALRNDGRKNSEIRKVTIKTNYIKNAHGSCLINFGDTSIICSANIQDSVPSWLKGKGIGWRTAEYSMLPYATNNRNERESTTGKTKGRTQEIQRLIGRSLRSTINLKSIGEKQINIDCDVINADGGTRTAAITGAWVALKLAVEYLLKKQLLKEDPIIEQIAAISCGIFNGKTMIDLNYLEDSSAETDANFVLTNSNKIIEIQATAEKKPFEKKELDEMLIMAKKEINTIFNIQKYCISDDK